MIAVVGQSAIALFTWRVFRPGEAWARALALGFMALLAGVALWQTASPGWRVYAAEERGAWNLLPAFSLITLGWAGAESLLYHAKLRRRLALGLADPITTDRLRLWSVSMLAAFAIALSVQALRFAGVQVTPEVMGLIVGPLCLVAASAMWLAFLPPRRYVRWVEARA